jgi:hypothetical protein
MTLDRIIEAQVEVARKGMSMADLFEEVWQDCASRRKP